MTPARSFAAAQTVPVRGDIDANVEQHVSLARAAAAEGAQVLVFPELSLTGYELDLADELAFAERDARLAPLVELAAAHRMTLIVGAPVRLASGLHIGAFILKPDGIDLHTKQVMGAFPASVSPDGVVPPAEATVFQPGDRDPLVPLGEDTAAVAVCADTGQPSHAQRAAGRGATAYLASMFIIPTYIEAESANLASYARRHAMAVVLANYGGPTGGLPSAGGSAIWSPEGELLAQLDATGAGIVIATESDASWRAETLTLARD
jgi:predicted amidohydrolase